MCTMLLDFYGHTLDDAAMATYMPLLSGTLDFFARHYGDVTVGANNKNATTLTFFPAQALETSCFGHDIVEQFCAIFTREIAC